jgi:chemotaxis protein CheX
MEDQVSQITREIWSTFLGLEVEAGGHVRTGYELGRSLNACVQIAGSWEGAVAIECPRPLAQTVAAAMMGAPLAEVTLEDTQDALGELANITGGNIKALLPEPCRLSLPAVAEGHECTLRIPGMVLETEVPFTCGDQPFVVRILRRKA